MNHHWLVTTRPLNQQMIASVRRISSELRPSVLDDFGPVGPIQWQAKAFEARGA